MQRIILIIIGHLLLTFQFSPKAVAQNILSKPTFSFKSGFYNSPISLTCSCKEPNAEVRFTRDGSFPTPLSELYVAPINLASRIGDPNTISGISTGNDFTSPDEVFKGHVITASCFKTGFTPSKPKANSYFIGENITERYASVAVVSLIADAGNFFNNDTGIYILGVNEFVCQLDACGNYGQRGDAWEREVHFEFWESSQNELAFGRQLGVRIHGGASRNYSQKALRFYARDMYGKKDLEYPLFGDEGPSSFKRFMLRAGGNDIETKMRDAYHQQFFTGTEIETQLYRPCVLFLNGEFWGYHGIRESYNKHYFRSYYDINRDSIDYISEGPPDIVPGGVQADEGDLVAFDALLDFIDNNDIGTSENYNYLKNEVNLQSIATVYIAELFLGNQDWPGNNVKLWRPRDNSRKWEWCLVDTDIAGNGIIDVNDFGLDIPPGEGSYTEPIILALLTNIEFRQFYINRWADLLNTRLLSENTGGKLDTIKASMTPIIEEQSERWFTPFGLDNWTIQMDEQKTWMEERVPIVWAELEAYYNITKANISLNVNDINQGSIQCNSIPTDEINTYPWNGDYFEEVPISLIAINKPGYRFVEWTGDISSTEKKIIVTVSNNLNLTAVFEPLAPTIVINEILASNSTSEADPAGEYDDWIELFNSTNTTIDLTGYSMSNIKNKTKWFFPENTKIGAYSYLIIWADNDTLQAGLHSSFKLNKTKGELRLYNADETLLDETSFAQQTTDISWGRYINATGDFMKMEPSHGLKNTSSKSTFIALPDVLKVFPNPAMHEVTIITNGESSKPLMIFDAKGALMYQSPYTGLVEEKINIDEWDAGFYIISHANKVQKLIVF